MPGFRLTLLGGFRLEDEGGREIAIASRKAQGMLAVLALSSPAAVTRVRIAAMFWGDLPDERARHSLRQLLSSLRRDAAVVEARGDALSLDTLVCKADASEFRQLARSADPSDIEAAVALYAGPLLDNLSPKEEGFEEWLRVERVRLAKLASEAMARLAAQHAGARDHEAAVRILRRWLAEEPANEEAHRALIRALDAMGRRSEALAQYQMCKEQLRIQLGVEPDAATQALCESVRGSNSGARSANKEGLPGISVLPFVNHGRTPELEMLAKCIAEDLNSQLARTPGFQVVAQAAVAVAVQSSAGGIQDMSQMPRARYLISGSLRQPEPGSVRVAIQIVNGESAQYVWTMQQDLAAPRATEEVDDFVAGAAAKIEQQLILAEAGEGGKRTDGLDAWDKMHQASSALFAAGWSEEAVDASVRLYREAIALDPKLALARAQKALIMALASSWGLLGGDAPREEARADAEKALELEPTKSEVLSCAACALGDLGEKERAVPLLERAIEENPNNAQAWAALGAIQLLRRQCELGVESLRRGLRISPTDYRRSVWLTALAGGLVYLERIDEALAAAQGACRADSKFYPAQIVLAVVLTKLGKEAEALRALTEARRIRPRLAIGEIRLWAGPVLDRPAASLGLQR
jgi:DNA-binding SARP family transcriptional activator